MAIPDDQHHHENQSFSSSVVVVMVPFPAQSHLNQLLQFAHVVSSYDIPVHYVGSSLHNSQVKSRSSNPLHHLTKIHFHDFQIPFLPYPPPNFCSKTRFPENMIPCFEASKHLRQPVASLLRSLSPTTERLVVVYDLLMASVVQDVVSLRNAESYTFTCASAFAAFAFRCEALGRKDRVPVKVLPSADSCLPSAVQDFVSSQEKMSFSKAGKLYNSCRAIEGSFIDVLAANDKISGKKKTWAVGPLHQTTVSKELSGRDKRLLEWLDKQVPNSILYISFGTTTSFSDEENRELALGLELSGVKFIWVLRDADKADIFSNEGRRPPQLPDGFEERVKGMGMVVREWVAQVEILGHPSTGGFMCHCGWNSCVESLSVGVPIVAWPMHSDQPMNALLVTDLLKVGVVIMEWRQINKLVSKYMISKAVRRLMASKEGGEIMKRADAMGEAVKRSVAEGGDCSLERDSFVAHITRKRSSLENRQTPRL
ncbi:UDP-glucuronosyl/UDP-glucosyltransferase [Trema orientale]|uniref:Glycosyltransferase n=1 Tax=Trema orientale TaxID=63057 RepID=A0A2P5A7D7_TREOI|nr:UDP-glucuronosyl/UDP-glucosyltransferase [Trema orientale]